MGWRNDIFVIGYDYFPQLFETRIGFGIKGRYTATEFKDIIFHSNLNVEKVVFNPPATIVLWKDGTKTVVKCQDGDEFSKEQGLAMAICKKAFGNKGRYNEVFKKWCD